MYGILACFTPGQLNRAAGRTTVPKFSLKAGDTTGHVFAPASPVPGDHLLIVERELLGPTTNQKVGTLVAAITFMKILPNDDALLLGTAEHHLNANVKPPAARRGDFGSRFVPIQRRACGLRHRWGNWTTLQSCVRNDDLGSGQDEMYNYDVN